MPESARAVLTARLVDHVLGSTSDDLPEEVLRRTRTRVVDALGVMAAGLRAPRMAAVVETAFQEGGAAEATVMGYGRKVPAPQAAMLNSMLLRSFDFEPVGAEGPGGRQTPAHITGTTLPVALAVAEAEGSTGVELLTALALGDDVSARLAFHSGFDVYSGQDNTGTVNILGATLIAARLMGLDRETARHALGIAVNQAAGTVGAIYDGAASFKTPMAFAARNAIVSCRLARAGISGPRDPLAGRFGFLDVFCADPDPAGMLDGLGEEFYADATIKPWSCCRAAQPGVDAATRIVAEHAPDPERIAAVSVRVPERTASGFVGQPFDASLSEEAAAAFSLRFCVAAALRHGTVRPEHTFGEAARDPQLRRLLDLVTLEGTLPQGRLGAEVTVRLEEGDVLQADVDVALGDIHAAPLSDEAVLEKFRMNLEFAGYAGVGDQVLATVHDLQESLGVGGVLAPFRR